MDPPEDGYGSATIFKAEAPGAQRFGSRVSGFGLGFELETQDSGTTGKLSLSEVRVSSVKGTVDKEWLRCDAKSL
jgi:hypothetical protein